MSLQLKKKTIPAQLFAKKNAFCPSRFSLTKKNTLRAPLNFTVPYISFKKKITPLFTSQVKKKTLPANIS